MTAAVTPTQFHRISRRTAVIAAASLAMVAALLYLEWRTVRGASPGEVAEQDTMCVAARIGLEGLCH